MWIELDIIIEAPLIMANTFVCRWQAISEQPAFVSW
jgi:hypothetical protein